MKKRAISILTKVISGSSHEKYSCNCSAVSDFLTPFKTKGGKMIYHNILNFICRSMITLALIFILSFTLNAHAMDGTAAATLQEVLGIQPDADYAKVDLAATPGGSVIIATVSDPSKMGGCTKGERVRLINLGNGEWKITRLADRSSFQITVYKEDGVMKITKTPTLLPEHSFEIGLETMYYKYKEDYEEGDDMEEDGFMYGLIGNYTYHHLDSKLMMNASLEYFFADDLDYDGQTWGGDPVKSDTDAWMVECRGLIGYDFIFNGKHLITPFVGIAYRYWNDDIGGIGGYEREIEYWYSPIGIKTVSHLSNKWKWGISAECDLFWSGKVKSHLSDVDPGYNDPEVNQDFGDGYGLRFSARLERELTKNCALSIEPYIRYWDIDKSNTETLTYNGAPIGYVWEPENKTTSYGLCLSFVF